MNSSPVIELKISIWQQIFCVTSIIAALFLFLGRFLWSMWHAPRGIDATLISMTIVIGAGISWWIYSGARRMWLETGLYLRADEETMTVGTREGRRILRWDEIYALTTDDKSTKGERGYWLSLRGRDDQVLMQWDRNWCRYTSQQIKRSDEIENFVRQKLRGMGRSKDEETAASQLWAQLHPFSSGAALEVRTNYGWIGWITFLLCGISAFFSWNHPTGGPMVGGGFLLFGAMGFYLIAAAAILRVDEETVEASSVFGRYRMEWREVTSVEMDELGNSLIFRGLDKRLGFSGPNNWKSAGKAEMMLFLAACCEKRHVPFDTRANPGFGGSKNVKVRRSS